MYDFGVFTQKCLHAFIPILEYNCELQNLQHRVQVAWSAFWRLYSVLRCRSPVPAHQSAARKVLYLVPSAARSPVQPPQGRRLVGIAAHRQLRLILKSPRHLHHTTKADVRQRSAMIHGPCCKKILCAGLKRPQFVGRRRWLNGASSWPTWASRLNGPH